MTLQTNWNYETSVQKVSGLVSELKSVTLKKSTLTDDIVKELYEARKELDSRGRNLPNIPNGTFGKGWLEYLNECGLSKSTVHRWLEHYEPEEQRLLTDEEYQAKKEEKRRAEMSIRDANNSRVSQAIKTGSFPSGWNPECQRLYEDRIKEERLRDERIRKMQEEMQKGAEERKCREDERRARVEEIDELVKGIKENITKRQVFKERIRISHDGKDDPFIDAILDYLDELEDDNRRIEACYNIIKTCKGIAVDLQRGQNG
jgi:hypothetical protein